MIYSRAVETVRDLFFTILATFILLATIFSAKSRVTYQPLINVDHQPQKSVIPQSRYGEHDSRKTRC